MSEDKIEYKEGEIKVIVHLPADGSMSVKSNTEGAHLIGILEMAKSAILKDVMGPARPKMTVEKPMDKPVPNSENELGKNTTTVDV